MNKFFYPRLAFTNIRKNRSIYVPYLLAGALVVSLLYSLLSIAYIVVGAEMRGGAIVGSMLMLSAIICGIFSLAVLFYINSFVMKRRKREFGLYSILGMEKRHISLVMFWEVLLTGGMVIVAGILAGALMSYLLFLLLLNVLHVDAPLTFQIPFTAVAPTVVLFCFGFLLVLLYDVVSVCRTDPIALLHSVREGEREPKTKWVLTLVGFAALGGGYAMALQVKTPSEALSVFFLAVLLVIIGTYCLFTAGSIAMLKLMRKKKQFYYKTKNFISVSGMIYRMKQNAAGLSNICILSTCVLVTLSSTICLYLGMEDILNQGFPRGFSVECTASEQNAQLLEDAVREHAEEYGLTVENGLRYDVLAFPMDWEDGKLQVCSYFSNNTVLAQCIPLEDYNRNFEDGNTTLGPDEILIHNPEGISLGDTLYLEKPYRIAGNADLVQLEDNAIIGYGHLVIVLPSRESMRELLPYVQPEGSKATREIATQYWFDLSGSREEREACYATMRENLLRQVEYLGSTLSRDEARTDYYELYGGLLFVGLFFIALFLLATVLIIYYKQITEGFDDHDRFQIMKKVGMSNREVRSTILKQVLMVFFLPLGMAVVHICVAFPVLCKLLLVFNMTNTTLFIFCTLGTVLVFALLYLVVYSITARTYYKIVQAK